MRRQLLCLIVCSVLLPSSSSGLRDHLGTGHIHMSWWRGGDGPQRAHCAGAPTSLVRLRGGGALSGFDQQLQDEIINDIKRDEQGKIPLFIEQLGQEEQTGAFKYGVGVEAAMPPVIGDTADTAMDDEGGADTAQADGALPAAVSTTREEQRAAREAEEAAEAKAWFAEKDLKYFHNSEFTDEPILGHTGMPQKRSLMPDDLLQTYLELRRDCPELSRFMRTLPHNNSLIPQALDDYGWHEGILRNGTRIKWCACLWLCLSLCL